MSFTSDSARPMSVWSASSVGGTSGNNNFGLGKLPKNHDYNSQTHLFQIPHKCKMNPSIDDVQSPKFLSWRKLHLSRAKLKASSKTSALLSGFAMVAMVELQLQNPEKIPSGTLIAFAVITTLLVAVHMLALMISTCILPNIEAICSMDDINLVNESPHERLHWYIETAWAFSTLLGLLLFLVEIAILCWVKFWEINEFAAWSASIILVPILLIFLAFAVHFYSTLVKHKYEMSERGIRELEKIHGQISQELHTV